MTDSLLVRHKVRLQHQPAAAADGINLQLRMVDDTRCKQMLLGPTRSGRFREAMREA
jgi:hypothetical protein